MSTPLTSNDLVKGLARTVKRIREIGILFLLKKIVEVSRQDGVGAGFSYLKRNTSALLRRTIHYGSYDRWIKLYDRLRPGDIVKMKAHIAGWGIQPLISIVMPTYNSNPIFLSAAIDSVMNQIYPNWELCIADDASTDPQVVEVLKRYQAQDNRIKVTFRQENGHISAASNTALELATGDWVALLDHDDLLSPAALYWVVDAINKHPNIQIIYSDEDKADQVGKRFDPYFKPDWNKDLFYSQNYFCHLGVYRKHLIDQIEGFRKGFEGAQDYDLTLRCIEKIDSKNIHHIPRLLYHWRSHALSTAQCMSSKNYAVDAGERALNEHFERVGIDGYVEAVPGGYRAHYALPVQPPLVSLIIPTRNAHALVRQCIESIIAKTTYQNYEIILVDNNSDEPASLEYFSKLASDGVIRLIRYPREFNYSAINNFAVNHAGGEIIGFINNDIEVIAPDWLVEMVSLASQSGVGAVGAKLFYPNGTLQHGGVIVGLGGVAAHSHKYYDGDAPGFFYRLKLISSYSAVTAACLVVKKSAYLDVGGFNEKDLAIAFNDVDFCLRLRERGYRNVWTPYAKLNHHESATRGSENTPSKVARFNEELGYMRNQWIDVIQSDPAYSPNLTLMHEDFSYSWPPRLQ